MRRLVALEPEIYEKLKRHTPKRQILSEIDRKMEEILNSDLPENEKLKLYKETLQKSMLFAKKSRPKPQPVVYQEKKNLLL